MKKKYNLSDTLVEDYLKEDINEYRLVLADYQDDDGNDQEDIEYLLKPGQTKGDLVKYLSDKCGFVEVYVHDGRTATEEEISHANGLGFDLDPSLKNDDPEWYGDADNFDEALIEARHSADWLDPNSLDSYVTVDAEGRKIKWKNATKKATLIFNKWAEADYKAVKTAIFEASKKIDNAIAKGAADRLDFEDLVNNIINKYTSTFKLNDENIAQQMCALVEGTIKNTYKDQLEASREKKHQAELNTNKYNRRVDSEDSSVDKIISLTPDSIAQIKTWLKNHVTGLKFKFPDDNDFTLSDDSHQHDLLVARWARWLEIFKKRCPDAKEGKDYELRPAGEEKDTTFSMWGPSAEITFDCKIAQAPIEVQQLMDNAIELSREAGNYASELNVDSKIFKSYYFGLALLRLFNNDIHFYKKDNNNTSPTPFGNVLDPIMPEVNDED